MTINTDISAALSGTVASFHDAWCIYRHIIAAADPNDPPQIFYIGTCPLKNVYDFPDARKNNEWRKYMTPERQLLIEIVAVGEKFAIWQMRGRMVATMQPKPHCNANGYDTTGLTRKIACSNGQTYRTQTEAARALSISQSVLSRHLRGDAGVPAVKNYTFWYVEE